MEEEVRQVYRSRIKENFSEEDLEFLEGLITSPYIDNTNDKADAILYKFREKNFIELAPATNRFVLLKGKYVYKFALDKYGIKDNLNEFEMSEKLQPYVTKTYETNGLITIAEYVNLITEKEFMSSAPHIRNILKELSEDFIFCDIGTIPKNFTNYGFNDDDEIKILDYGYIYPKDPKILFCTKDGGNLVYTENYDQFVCTRCGEKYPVTDILYRMSVSEEAYKKPKKKGSLVVKFKKKPNIGGFEV
ncbi:MAG: hypothetical protein SPF22_08270 [Candidatus Onthovivens sp.]|nr:hypothetical protein [Candidatus Onthovivens sp.]